MNGIQTGNQTIAARRTPVAHSNATTGGGGEQISFTTAADLEVYTPGEFTARDNVETGAKTLKFGGTVLSALKAVGTKAGFLGSVVSIPDDAMKAGKLVAEAGRTGESGDINRAVGGVTYAASTTVKGVKAGLETATLLRDSKFAQRRRATKAATDAFRGAAPKTKKSVAAAAGKQAAASAAAKAKPNQIANAASKAAQGAAKGNLVGATGAASRTAAKATLRQGGAAAGKAATASLAKSAALKTAGKIGGRFIPGVNIGIAALDSAAFASTMADPNASWAKKGIRGLTAAASIVGATNIPILSQAGSIVSGAASIVDSFIKK